MKDCHNTVHVFVGQFQIYNSNITPNRVGALRFRGLSVEISTENNHTDRLVNKLQLCSDCPEKSTLRVVFFYFAITLKCGKKT